jgi:hypothetical protein
MSNSSRFNYSISLFIILLTTFTSFTFANDYQLTYEKVENYDYDDEKTQTIELFLQKTVPGLDVTYRKVFNTFIDEGLEIYIKGGFIRDLLAPVPHEPHDVDFVFSGTKDELEAILKKHQWQYMTKPNYSLITIGDRKKICMEGVTIDRFLPRNVNLLEFTINNIYYCVNTRTFLVNSGESFDDLENNRLRIIADDWKEWLYSSHGGYRYARLFRVWKMIGKGYIYQVQLERFIQKEALLAQQDDETNFNNELLWYLSSHVESFDDINRGCFTVMGEEWQSKFLSVLKKEAEQRDKKIYDDLERFTYFTQGKYENQQ